MERARELVEKGFKLIPGSEMMRNLSRQEQEEMFVDQQLALWVQ